MVTGDGGSAVEVLKRSCSRNRCWVKDCSSSIRGGGVMQGCTHVVSSDMGHCGEGMRSHNQDRLIPNVELTS